MNEIVCTRCGNDDPRLMQHMGIGLDDDGHTSDFYHCEVCSKDFSQLILPPGEEEEV